MKNIHPFNTWNYKGISAIRDVREYRHTNFGYIAPIEYLDYVPEESHFHLCLAHLCIDQRYCDFYRAKRERGDMIIMDNSAYEFGEGIESDRLLDLIDFSGIRPHVIVAPDYPGQHYSKTLHSLEKFKDAVERRKYDYNVSIMGVPQGEVGEHRQWLDCYEQMVYDLHVGVIGMSILAMPNAFQKLTGTKDVSHNRLFGSLYLVNGGAYTSRVWHHYLGASSPSELQLIHQLGLADSVDSSSPIWHGINSIKYDDTATGLVNGKTKKHVDFYLQRDDVHLHDPRVQQPHDQQSTIDQCIRHNIEYVKKALNLN